MNHLILQLRKEKREEWAKLHDKACLWCGSKDHNRDGFCQHLFMQTWDREQPDCDHFENWLKTTDYQKQFDKILNGE